jgi:hypothetical protein
MRDRGLGRDSLEYLRFAERGEELHECFDRFAGTGFYHQDDSVLADNDRFGLDCHAVLAGVRSRQVTAKPAAPRAHDWTPVSRVLVLSDEQ